MPNQPCLPAGPRRRTGACATHRQLHRNGASAPPGSRHEPGRRPARSAWCLCRGALAALVLPALLLAAATPALAQWVWKDASGRLVASDRPPPPEVAAKDIVSRPSAAPARPAAGAAATPATAATAPGAQGAAQARDGDTPAAGARPAAADGAAAGRAPAAAAQPTPLAREVEARKRAAEAERQAQAKAEADRLAAQRAENCQRARGHLAALDSGQRMSRTNLRGEREVLDDSARAAEAQRARAVIASDCR